MARISIDNPFDKTLEPKGFLATKLLLSGNRITWEELSTAADGLSTRTLGAIVKRLEKSGVVLDKVRRQHEGGTYYQATLKTDAPRKVKKTPKVARPTPVKVDPPKAVKTAAVSAPVKKASKVIRRKSA